MLRRIPRRIILLLLVAGSMLIYDTPSFLVAAQALPHWSRDAMQKLFQTLTDEAARRKKVRYAFIRNNHTEVMSHLVRQDVLRTSLAYLKMVMMRELYLPHKPLGFYVGRGTSLEFIKFPPDQDVYRDPWLE
jgi:hypothetical protein